MYNKELNDEWVEKLKDAVRGKRVLMVGNAASMFSDASFGKLIDGYDFVIRFGKGVPYKAFQDYLGTKTDLWFFGCSRAGMHPKFKNVPFKLYTVAQYALYKDNDAELSVHRDMLNGKLQVYQDFFMAGTAQETLAASIEINGDKDAGRISQGAQCIHFFANHVQCYESIDLIGFDFFGQGFTYTYSPKDLKRTIPKEQPVTSWHMPLISKNFDKNPHNPNGNEERYIRSVPNLNVIEMPEIDLVKLEEALKLLRGKDNVTNIRPGVEI